MIVFADVLLLFMSINISSMFEIHMLVAIAVMFYILELIMKILPNIPTCRSSAQAAAFARE